MRLTRRSIIHSGLIALAAPALSRFGVPFASRARAQQVEWRHGLSLFGELKYPPGFKHFDYVNPNALKGGTLRMMAFGTFDNFNVAVSGLKGSIAMGATMITDSLQVSSLDEVSTDYGLIAEAVTHPADFATTTFRLRASARHHDGKPITVEDVIYSMEMFKKYSPMQAAYYRHVAKMEQTGEREVTFIFDSPGNREMPVILGQLEVLPKHWWEGTDAAGKKRDIGATTLEPPLGNGAYRVKEFIAGRTVVYERVKDYWGKDLNVNVGRDNFDELRFEYFRDSTVAIEAFKADHLDWRTENSAKNWATAYDFPAVKDKRVLLEEFPQRNRGIMQAFAFNTRREKFKDARLRRAFNLAYDFEEMNKQMFFGQYRRISSYFDGTELASSGLPQGDELAILETVRDKVPPEVFTTAYTNPVGGSAEKVRANLREGTRLLRDAGYEVRNQKLVNTKTGEPVTVEILADDPAVERFILFYKPSLERLGVTVTVRVVDDAQYENRMRTWDFEMTVASWPESLSPGNEQRDLWSTQAADTPGSRNYIGMKNPAVDALIDRIIFSKNRAELVAATHALDRVLLWNHYVVPQFTHDRQRSARWDRFSRPETMPKYGAAAFPTIWWWDAAKAAKTGVALVTLANVDLTRRDALVLGGAAFASLVVGPAAGEEGSAAHGMSAFGDLKYPADFKHFDYVDPHAPKGGTFSHVASTRAFNQNFLTFNSLNSFILKGDGALGMELTFASLMTRAQDEPDAMYGLAAKSVRVSADGLTYSFALRPEAKFHDGSKITAHDVVFSLSTMKDKGHPIAQQLLRDFTGVQALDDATVVVTFAQQRGRDVPLFAAALPIFSRAYYSTKSFDETTLDVPLGGGAYKVGRFEAGRYVEYERVKDWWGGELPVSRGRNNFDLVRFEYYRDRDVAFEGFTGKSYLFREEFTSRIWATRYDFPALRDNRVKRDVLADDTPSGAQGWFFNTRRDKFKDKRLREALIYAFDFEWTNKQIMYGSYRRTHSVFQNSDMMAIGKPGTDELALLEPFRGKVADEVFGEPFVPPVSDGSGQDRALLRKASATLQEAGYTVKNGKRVTPQGAPLSIEFLLDEPSFQPHHATFIKNLTLLGFDASIRMVDPVQYKKREDDFDFDLLVQRFAFSSTPGDSMRSYFSSQAAAIKGSQNLAGIADPVIDALVDKIIAADSRPALTTACKALDRVIRAGRYWIPHWYKASHWIAYWDVFGRPSAKPRYGRGIPETWWYDRDKAAKLEQRG